MCLGLADQICEKKHDFKAPRNTEERGEKPSKASGSSRLKIFAAREAFDG